MKNKISVLAALVFSVGMQAANAGSTSGPMTITTVVSSACDFTTSNMNGAVNPITGDGLMSGVINAKCSNALPYSIKIDGGLNGTIANRKMVGTTAGNTDKLSYNLYSDTTRTTLFGDGTTGSTVALTGNGLIQTTTVYGKVPSQYVKADTYTDTVTITLAY